MSIESHVTACVGMIEQQHEVREHALVTSRLLTRQCARCIRAAHRAEFDEAARMLSEAQDMVSNLRASVETYPGILTAGYTQDALKEYTEAALVYAFLTGSEPPSADDLRVEPASYLNGLAEAASELRRAILDRLRQGRVYEVEPLLEIMDDVYSLLMTVDYPDAITGGLRRSNDALRPVLERTRGDVTAAIRQEQLTAALAACEQHIGEA